MLGLPSVALPHVHQEWEPSYFSVRAVQPVALQRKVARQLSVGLLTGLAFAALALAALLAVAVRPLVVWLFTALSASTACERDLSGWAGLRRLVEPRPVVTNPLLEVDALGPSP